MASPCPTLVLFFSLLLAVSSLCSSSQIYVVYMGDKSDSRDDIPMQNHQLLSSLNGGSMEKARESHVYSYSNGFRGFAAKLTEEQAAELSEMPGVVSVFPNQRRILHTTHSWEFMGITGNEATSIPGFSTRNQENVIIGFIDTGIWPELPSFNDEGMSPVPSRWNGKCQAGESFTNTICNKKIIGARYYLSGFEAESVTADSATSENLAGFKSARDSQGHGTHTASTAAGRLVDNVSFNGLAAGQAHGGATTARIAVYKSCWNSGCYDADLLAAFDDAIKDGVDILSLSLGPESPQGDYFSDAISIGSFHAASHGILVVSSAGNSGTKGSATNLAPWMLTVGASSTDRQFSSTIVLGGQKNITGESLNNFGMEAPATLISASEANAGYFTPYQSSFCLDSSLDEKKARGKVLLCRHSPGSLETRQQKSLIVKKAGGVGMILIDESNQGVATYFDIPAAAVGTSTGSKMLAYANRTRGARSQILASETVLGPRAAPWVAAFSSRGPNSLTPEILKPDITAPGLNILAAWSPSAGGMKFNIISGTSMSCPHVTGIAALIKSVYPKWSPAAIKSAIMTTANVLDKKGKLMKADPGNVPATPFDYGSGFPDSTRVLNPGLVYDTRPADYKAFLCSIGYDDKSLQKITGDNSVCARPTSTASNLNYPSITVPDLKTTYSITRTVTYVGRARRMIYRAAVTPPAGVNVTVVPDQLYFSSHGERAKFTVKFRAVWPSKDYVFGSLRWRAVGDRKAVTSPLVVRVTASDSGLM